jgi:PleD family two-component response regulator
MLESRQHPAVILLASHGEWMGRSVESVLALNGYAVLRVDSGRRALAIARATPPDALILDSALPDMGGVEVARALSTDPLFDLSTPVVITAPSPVSNGVRVAAYQAGVWEFCIQPVDTESLLLKLGTFMRARQSQSRSESPMIDPLTGLYSAFGLQHVAEQLGARAARMHEALGCVVVTSDAIPDHGYAKSSSVVLAEMAQVCRSQSRKSDVIGYVGDQRFAILTPQTDRAGVRGLVSRLEAACRTGGPPAHELRLHSGYAVPDFSQVEIDASEIVRRASRALEFAQSDGNSGFSSGYEELPVS